MKYNLFEKESKKLLKSTNLDEERIDGDYSKAFPYDYNEELHFVYEGELYTYYKVNDDYTIYFYTDKECIELGYKELGAGEVLEGDDIIHIPAPSSYHTWNFETQEYYLTAEAEEKIEEDLISDLASLKYNKQESLYVADKNVDNITASYNYLMLNEAISSVEENLEIRWKNLILEPKRVDIDSEILIELKTLKSDTRLHYQKCFCTQEAIEDEIETLTPEEMLDYDLEQAWVEKYVEAL